MDKIITPDGEVINDPPKARVKTMRVSLGRKVSLERVLRDSKYKYESIDVGMDIWADIPEGADLHDVSVDLWGCVEAQITREIKSYVARAKNEVPPEIYLGLPSQTPTGFIPSTEVEMP